MNYTRLLLINLNQLPGDAIGGIDKKTHSCNLKDQTD